MEDGTMRRVAVQLGLVVALITFALTARAQGYALISFAYPFHAHELAGVVVDDTGAPVPGVVIDDCVQTFRQVRAPGDAETPVFEEKMILDCHFELKHVLASTTTDSKGRFRLPHTKMGTTRYLYLSHYGFDPMQITVKLRWFARRNLRIKLVIAT
jgi:hypothetical protein